MNKKTNWELLEFDQYLMDCAIEEFSKIEPEWNKFKELAEWINLKPFPYKPKCSKNEDQIK